ncbi:DUF4838 domain-containing protein [Paenibacillus sp. MBLB4367]|uniref:DUF4838 domain-containing protein n=1 Tax=Paenibacillus sp. MBLB4367 TaxID=3384767 RepID=UPI0039081D3E
MIYTIYVNKRAFRTIREAADAEREVDWWDERDERAAACTECFAAVELQRHLHIALGEGARVIFETTDRRPESGNDSADANAGVSATAQSFYIGTVQSNPYIKDFVENGCFSLEQTNDEAGDSFLIETLQSAEERAWVLCGAGRTGALYAVYAFLERIGFRWYAPGEAGAVYPERIASLPEIRCLETPDFRTRGCYSEFIDDRSIDFINWMARNRMNYAHLFTVTNPHALKKRGIRIAGGGHDMLYKYLDPGSPYPYAHPLFASCKEDMPPDPYPISPEYKGDADGDGTLSYAEAHPEWFALVDGERSHTRSPEALAEQYFAGDNHCLTHPGAADELSRNVIRALAGGDLRHVDDLNFWLLDNGNWCSCETCVSSGNYTNRLIATVHHLRQKICKAMEEGVLKRNVRILFPAYHETLAPPDKPLPEAFDYRNCFAIFFPIERCYVHTFADEGCTETNRHLHHNYRSWALDAERSYQGEMFIGEYYGVRTFAALPVLLSRMIATDIPYYHETGTRHFYYMHMTSGRWGMLALNNYLYAALLWNVKADGRAIMDAYLANCYKETACEMKSFYEQLEEAFSNVKYVKHYQVKDGERYSLWQKLRNREESLFPLEHMKYDSAGETSDSGISLVDSINKLADCRAILDAALLKAGTPAVIQRLLEDEMRFDYGQTMMLFYYRMVRTMMLLHENKPALAKSEFASCITHAAKLSETKFPLSNYDYSKYYDNGLNASWIKELYEKLLTELQE